MNPEEARLLVEELNAGIAKHEELRHYAELANRAEAELEKSILRDINNLKTINEMNNKMAELRVEAGFYKVMLEMVREHEQLQTIWDDLMVTMKLIDPEIEQKFEAVRRGWR